MRSAPQVAPVRFTYACGARNLLFFEQANFGLEEENSCRSRVYARFRSAPITVKDVIFARTEIDDRNSRGYKSEEHTSELKSLMRISYAVFCLKKKNNININSIKILPN